MAIIRSGQPDSMGHIDTTQREFRDQVDDVADELLQLAGVAESGTATSDPLSAPYVLYVDANIGDDAFVSGVYSAGDTVERRIAMQKLTCGYTQARPFKTINRAAIEAAIITSGTWFDGSQAQRDRQLVSIVVAPGEYIVENGAGVASPTIADLSAPTAAELRGYNDATGGVILPRGCSLVSLDLRKTIIRPAFVPARGTEGNNYGNRRAIFKVTGTGYYYGFTFKDHLTTTTSHHLLSCFEFTPRAQLNTFYTKVMNTFDTNWDLDDSDEGTAREYEYEIVGEQPATPVPATDTVGSASPYIYNISVRSVYGLCGVFANGTSADGFRSMVIAQFTGVSLQKDFRCWQVYSGGAWATATSEQQIITAGPDNVRMNPEQRSFHIRAVNKAVIQEVSVFAIGQGIHHWVESGGELTITNSNSNFGGCAALAEGYRDEPGPSDGAWEPQSYKVALSPFAKTASIERIYLGTVSTSNNTATAIDLDDDLEESSIIPGQPAVLARDGYTLKEDDLVWIENTRGKDYYAELSANPWVTSNRNRINVQAAFTGEDGAPGTGDNSDIENRRMYVRRFIDTRTVEERTYTVKLEGPAANRITPRNYVLQDATTDWADTRLSMVANATLDRAGNDTTMDVELRNRNNIAAHATGTYYRKGDCITRNNKCLQAIVDNYGIFDADDWIESYVHMESGFDPESPITNAHPILIFDGDTLVSNEPSPTCGFTIGTAIVEAQYESATDYKGLSNYNTNDGLSLNLTPAASADARVTAIGSGSTRQVEMRRPSNIRLFGHAFEWAGFGNYSKALPQYQGDLSAANKFTYYFTNEDGGRVYVSGFNEEGFAVTAQGLIDLETGEVRRAVDIGSPDIDPPDVQIIGNATTAERGIVILESANSIDGLTNAEKTSVTAEINSDQGTTITYPYLREWGQTLDYAPLLGDDTRRVFVCDDWANVGTDVTNATAYPLYGGGTINLTEIPATKRFTTIAAAYQSLPFGFSLPDGSQVEIYLLSSTHDEGTIRDSFQVGAEDSSTSTWILPLYWNDRNNTQVLQYSMPGNTFNLSRGYFRNVTFYARNTINGEVGQVRWRIEATLPAIEGSSGRTYTIVGQNIRFTNLQVNLNKTGNDTVTSAVILFKGAHFSPYGQAERHNSSPIYFKFQLNGNGTFGSGSNGRDDFRWYDIIAFAVEKDKPLTYGAAQCTNTNLPTSEQGKRNATAQIIFDNNSGASRRILFHYQLPNSTIHVDGADSVGSTESLTWQLEGQWEYRLFGFYTAFFFLDGVDCNNGSALFTARGTTAPSWGGFRNLNNSTNTMKTGTPANNKYSPGPFSQYNSQRGDWGVYGDVSNGQSLLGRTSADESGSDYMLESNSDRYNIVLRGGTNAFTGDDMEPDFIL